MNLTQSPSKRRTIAGKSLSCILAITALSFTGIAGAQDIRATVDGNMVSFPDVQPVMVNGRVMVPVRGVFEHMNASVNWDDRSQTIVAQRGTDTITLALNSYTADVNGRRVNLDAPAVLRNGRTIVPLRFLSESLNAEVTWLANSRTVAIITSSAVTPPPVAAGYDVVRIDAGTVIPFSLNQVLSSNKSEKGDRFKATLDTDGYSNYQGVTEGAILEGHVDSVRAKSGSTPGVIGLAFDRIRMPDGQAYSVSGTLIGLDSKSVENDNGRIIAKAGSKNDNLQYVGYGAGGGVLLAVITKGNVLTNSVIGAALGFLYGEIKKDSSKANDVQLAAGTKFGMKLTPDLTFRVPTPESQ